MSSPGPSRAHDKSITPSPFWLLLLAVALTELMALPVRVSRVANEDDWRAAGELVRAQFQAGDALTVEPAWADPWLRWTLGDVITLADAGRSDVSAYRRQWALTLRGLDAPNTPRNAPDIDVLAGPVRVRRWTLPAPVVRYDFASHVKDAVVARVVSGEEQACEWRTMPPTRGGGLGVGALFPRERFVCDARRPWLFVAPVVLEDLHLQPRYCLWQHPQGREPILSRFDNVTLQDELVLEGGLYYEHERNLERGPVDVTVRFNQQVAGRMTHNDGDGWKRMTLDTHEMNGQSVSVQIEVSAAHPHFRSFCWNAQTRVTDTKVAQQ